MYKFIIIGIVAFFVPLAFLGLTQPACVKKNNPFTGPKFSWKLSIFISAVISAGAVSAFCFLPSAKKKKSPDENGSANSIVKKILTGSGSENDNKNVKKTQTENASTRRLSIPAFSI
jgi:hypothetical protein